MISQIQTELFPDLGSVPFYWARDKYLAAADLVGAEDSIIVTLKAPVVPDGRVLWRLYDRVAKHYRLAHHSNQVSLFSSQDFSFEEQKAEEWCQFYFNEVAHLVEDNRMASLLVGCVAGNDGKREESLATLISLLDERYCGERCVRCMPLQPVRGRDEWIADLVRGRDWGAESTGKRGFTDTSAEEEEC